MPDGAPIMKVENTKNLGADPAAVIFDTVKSATARGYDMVIAACGGRLYGVDMDLPTAVIITRILPK